MTYTILKENHIYISDILELINEKKNDTEDLKKYIYNNSDYEIKNFTEWFREIKKQLKKYSDWELIKFNDINDISELFKDYITEEIYGTFSFNGDLSDIELVIECLFETQNYYLIKHG